MHSSGTSLIWRDCWIWMPRHCLILPLIKIPQAMSTMKDSRGRLCWRRMSARVHKDSLIFRRDASISILHRPSARASIHIRICSRWLTIIQFKVLAQEIRNQNNHLTLSTVIVVCWQELLLHRTFVVDQVYTWTTHEVSVTTHSSSNLRKKPSLSSKRSPFR